MIHEKHRDYHIGIGLLVYATVAFVLSWLGMVTTFHIHELLVDAAVAL